MPVDNQIYDRLAETWWRPGSPLGGLDTLNPGRFACLDRVLGGHALRVPARLRLRIRIPMRQRLRANSWVSRAALPPPGEDRNA
jgi:hypothetical protein